MIDQYEKSMRELARGIRAAVEKYGKTVFTEDFDGMRILKREELKEIATPRHKKKKED